MKVLVTMAVEAEFAPWRRLRSFRAVRAGTQPLYEASLDGADVQVLLTGVGACAGEGVRELLRVEQPDVVIVTGLAGGLKPEHRAGEILVARAVRQGRGSRCFESDASLCELAIERGAKSVEMFLTSDAIVRTSSEKARLGEWADAVEMESFSILNEMAARGIPAVALRAVSDTVSEDLPLDFSRAVTADGQLSLAKVLAQLLSRPHQLFALVSFGKRARRAAGNLATFLDSYLLSLARERRPSVALAEVAAR